MHSCLYEGIIRHRRYSPVEHAFGYRIFLLYLDLAELDQVFRRRWLWSTHRMAFARFHRADHFGDPRVPLDQAVRDLVESKTGRRPEGPIRLLTHLRYFGYAINPVSFFYCYDPADTGVETLVAEVHNTPWGERHCYVLPGPGDQPRRELSGYRIEKEFHVSPFMGMDLQYEWRVTEPGERLGVKIANLRSREMFFEAELQLQRRALDAWQLARVLCVYPLLTAKVFAAIYWQALRLWMKKCPLYNHPRNATPLKATPQ